jgi:hypothetical protein
MAYQFRMKSHRDSISRAPSENIEKFRKMPTIEELFDALKEGGGKRNLPTKLTDSCFILEIVGCVVLAVTLLLFYLGWIEKDVARPIAYFLEAMVWVFWIASVLVMALWAVSVICRPAKAYARSLQERIARERALDSRLHALPASTLLKLSRRLDLEARIVFRRMGLAGVLIAGTTLAISLGKVNFSALGFSTTFGALLPFIVAFTTGGVVAALILLGVLEKLDRVTFVLQQAAEHHQSNKS